ncbi:hypothetical protein [Amycolatopsis aidingensis]|uniref:hypothetical protein n=1 Tax=Amycolatopsis aidingensis TaxID=2842453 RepID=UPI001E63B4DA|nr:hypothetical protein [Amycolatopsis aidingensis]
MTRRAGSVLMVAAVAWGLTGCSGDEAVPDEAPTTTASPSTTSATQTPEDAAAQAALEVYEGYWRVSEAAEKDPDGKDWRAELGKYLVDPELTRHVLEIENLASVPAHMVGNYQRSPEVTSVSLREDDPRVTITDCLDRTQLQLVSDKPGEEGKSLDHPDQPRRYEFEAQVVRYPSLDNQWFVQVVDARLEEPC